MRKLAKRRKGFTVVKWYSVKALSRDKVVECERLYRGKVIALHSGKVVQWCGGHAIKCYCGKVRQKRMNGVGRARRPAHA